MADENSSFLRAQASLTFNNLSKIEPALINSIHNQAFFSCIYFPANCQIEELLLISIIDNWNLENPEGANTTGFMNIQPMQ